LNIFSPFRIFEQLALALKNRVCPIFHCIEYIFGHSGFLSNYALALKIFTVLNTLFTFRIFEQLALALKNRVCPDVFHCIEIFFIIQAGFLSNLRLP